MIQLELSTELAEQEALVCDWCLRAWFRSGRNTGDALRAAAADRGWSTDHAGDMCPRCTQKTAAGKPPRKAKR